MANKDVFKCFPYTCEKRNTIFISSLIVAIIYFSMAMYMNWTYVTKLEKTKCKCSEDKIRTYIKYIPIVTFIIIIIKLYIGSFHLRYLRLIIPLVLLGCILFTLSSHLYVLYYDKINMKKCNCARDWRLTSLWTRGVIYRCIPTFILFLVMSIFLSFLIHNYEYVLSNFKYIKLKRKSRRL